MANAEQLSLGMPFPHTFAAGFTNFGLDQTTDQLEFIFSTSEALTITRLGFRYGVRTGTPPTYKISLQGVDTSGNPDGTIKGGGSPASTTFTPPADTSINGLWQWKTLDNSYAAAAGEVLALVIAYSSGTVDGSNFSSFTQDLQSVRLLRPYAITNNAGARTRDLFLPVFGYSSASRVYGKVVQSTAVTDIGNNTAGADEYALAFTIPSAWWSTYTVRGIRHQLWQRAAATLNYVLYTGTTALQTKAVDADTDGGATTEGFREIYFDTPLSTLTSGTQYRISVQPTSVANAARINRLVMATAGDLDAWPGGQAFYSSTRLDLGAWSDVTTERPCMEPIFGDITGAGGLLVNPGMQGGCRG